MRYATPKGCLLDKKAKIRYSIYMIGSAKKTTFILLLIATISIVVFILAFFTVTTIRFLVIRPILIEGASMEPTISDNTLKYVNTLKKPDFYDVAIFYYAEDGEDVPKGYYSFNEFAKCMPFIGSKIKTSTTATLPKYVKRVVGLPGDTIELRAERADNVNRIFLYRNGNKVEEEFIMLDKDNVDFDTATYGEELRQKYGDEGLALVKATEPYVVPEGCYYVLGDNRDGSRDSRVFSFGAVPEKYFLGVLR